MIDKLYIIPSLSCNLRCPHCIFRNDVQNVSKSNYDLIIEKLASLKYNRGILFGGEPLLLQNYWLEKFFGYCQSISSNLLLLDQEKVQLIKENNIEVATSWNPKRFNNEQYTLWLSSIKLLEENNIDVTILITLTKDLLTSNIIDVLQDINKFNNIYGIKFEPEIPSSKELINNVDDWLCEINDKWNFKFPNILADNYKNGNLNLCKNVWSINPDCSLVNSCPTGDTKFYLNYCLDCKYNKICRPCVKQNICTFFEKFYLKVVN